MHFNLWSHFQASKWLKVVEEVKCIGRIFVCLTWWNFVLCVKTGQVYICVDQQNDKWKKVSSAEAVSILNLTVPSVNLKKMDIFSLKTEERGRLKNQLSNNIILVRTLFTCKKSCIFIPLQKSMKLLSTLRCHVDLFAFFSLIII